jgi:hypothetical protein
MLFVRSLRLSSGVLVLNRVFTPGIHSYSPLLRSNVHLALRSYSFWYRPFHSGAGRSCFRLLTSPTPLVVLLFGAPVVSGPVAFFSLPAWLHTPLLQLLHCGVSSWLLFCSCFIIDSGSPCSCGPSLSISSLLSSHRSN